MYNNDINWKAEKPSNPTKDAVDRIWDRIQNKITTYKNDEIKELYRSLMESKNISIKITTKNVNIIYNEWKNSVNFKNPVENELDLINLFLVDLLNGTKYKQKVMDNISETEQQLIREGTYLNKYQIQRLDNKILIIYNNDKVHTITDTIKYSNFWNKYNRPPEKQEFLNILERSAMLYSDKYRRDTGGEYTPHCFVKKQNEILSQHYNLDEFIVCDTCAGVGNLENQFGPEFKKYCYLSTLEANDVEICKIKGFENVIQYDYLANTDQPKWIHRGTMRGIDEICKLENKKLMIIINPPYQRKKEFKYDLAIEFFNKIIQLKPQVVVYYFKTEPFLRDEIKHYIDSKYKIVSHIMSNASTTFMLSDMGISQVIFDKDKGEEIDKSKIKIDRYEVNPKTQDLDFQKSYTYNQTRPNLIKEMEKEIKKNSSGLVLGQWCYLTGVMVISNGGKEKNNKITTNNLKYCLLSKGINFNTHGKYFERNDYCYRGTVDEISQELVSDSVMFSLFYIGNLFSNKQSQARKTSSELLSDSVMFSLFYKGNLFSNKEQPNYIMPFTSWDFKRYGLNCIDNNLNVLYNENENGQTTTEKHPPFDFREWLKQFTFSDEAKDLYNAALNVFVYYHTNYDNTNFNDSFYDITNVVMNKDVNSFQTLENDTRTLYRVKTTKGTKGFGRNTIKSVVNSKDLPIFYEFFDRRDILARKINKQLVDNGLLLWERENIY